MTTPLKTSPGWSETSSSQAASGAGLSQLVRALAKNASRYDLRMATTVPPSKAWLPLPLATSSEPFGSTARPVGKKRRVLLGPRGPNGGGRNSGGSLQASVQRTRRIRNFLDIRAALLGPMAPPVYTIPRPAI